MHYQYIAIHSNTFHLASTYQCIFRRQIHSYTICKLRSLIIFDQYVVQHTFRLNHRNSSSFIKLINKFKFLYNKIIYYNWVKWRMLMSHESIVIVVTVVGMVLDREGEWQGKGSIELIFELHRNFKYLSNSESHDFICH